MILIISGAGFIATLQKRQGLQVACQKEITNQRGCTDVEQLAMLVDRLKKNSYGQFCSAR